MATLARQIIGMHFFAMDRCRIINSIYIQTRTNSYKLIQTHTNSYKLIQTHTNLHKLIQTHTNSYKLTQTHTNSHKVTQSHTLNSPKKSIGAQLLDCKLMKYSHSVCR